MRDVAENEEIIVEKIVKIFIDEETYQCIKKKLNKSDDNFSVKECKALCNYCNFL